MAATPKFVGTDRTEAFSLVNATGAVGTTLTTAPTNSVLACTAHATLGSVISSFVVATDESTAKVLVIYRSIDAGTTKFPIGAISIPINSGQSGAIANVDILASLVLLGFPVDLSGRNCIILAAAERLYVGVQVAVTAAKFLIGTISIGDYN